MARLFVRDIIPLTVVLLVLVASVVPAQKQKEHSKQHNQQQEHHQHPNQQHQQQFQRTTTPGHPIHRTPTVKTTTVGTTVAGSEKFLPQVPHCNVAQRYRTMTGECNNLHNPLWGRVGLPLRRLLPPVYDNHNGDTPRLRSTQPGGGMLPGARKVSTSVHIPVANRTTGAYSLMMMQWGQFLDHDITFTDTETSPQLCCQANLGLSETTLHPDVRTGGPCNPILAPLDDAFFDTEDTRCMEVTRSRFIKDNNFVREQINDATTWVDASHIYGNDVQTSHELRLYKDGKLRFRAMNGHAFLPRSNDDSLCFIETDSDYCFKAGDTRSNNFPGLMALHVIFLRYHNQLCDGLKARHPNWNDEILYQEARRIVIALMQKITYSEYLLTLLGRTAAEQHNLLEGDFNYAYHFKQDPTFSNVFVTAAYRFGHTSIPGVVNINGARVETGDLYRRPSYVLNSMDHVVEALLNDPQSNFDVFYPVAVTNEVFEPPNEPKKGYDLAALNIHRGRDHGLPPYNAYRAVCGLPRKTTFSSLDTASELFQSVYGSVEDIDTYSGGLSEAPVGDSTVGPLIQCILAQQFKNLKFGDRFWYENIADPHTAFTRNQIFEINHMRLAKIICDVTDITAVQPDVFRAPTGDNVPVACSSLPDLDVNVF